MIPNTKISSSILSEEGIKKLVGIQRMIVGVSLEVGVTSLMERILGTCNWRSTIYGGSYVVSDGEGLLPVWNLLLMMIGTIVTGPNQRLLPVSLFVR